MLQFFEEIISNAPCFFSYYPYFESVSNSLKYDQDFR